MRKKSNRSPLPETTLQITGLSHEGRGIAEKQGKTVFVRQALPGETVQARYTAVHGRYDEAETLHIEQASPDRVTPPCAAFNRCGACSLQHLSLEKQWAHKQQTLLEHLRHFGQQEPKVWLTPITGPSVSYRHKARLAVRYVTKKERVLVGFRETNGRHVADCEACEVLHPAIGYRIAALRQLLDTLSIKESIPQIEVAVGENAAVLIFRHLKPLSDNDIQSLLTFGDEHQLIIAVQSAGPESVKNLATDKSLSYLNYSLPEHQCTFDFSPLDFTQINPTINRQMVNQAIQLLTPNSQDQVLDLFCGLGNFSLPLAKRVQRLVGVEGDAAMVERAQHNANLNHLTNTQFFAANLDEPFESLPFAQKNYSQLLLDPPRSGAKYIVEHIAALGTPAKILYVSCNPATLARDCGILVHQHGYQLQQAGIIDMFPHTSHCEAMVLLSQ